MRSMILINLIEIYILNKLITKKSICILSLCVIIKYTYVYCVYHVKCKMYLFYMWAIVYLRGILLSPWSGLGYLSSMHVLDAHFVPVCVCVSLSLCMWCHFSEQFFLILLYKHVQISVHFIPFIHMQSIFFFFFLINSLICLWLRDDLFIIVCVVYCCFCSAVWWPLAILFVPGEFLLTFGIRIM